MSKKEKQKLDPVLFAVLKAKLDHIAWVVRDVMLMSSRSTILTTVQDYSTGILDKDGNTLTLPDMLPAQMVAISPAIQAMIEAYKGDIEPGDLFVNNSPYHGNFHIPELTMACPVFYQGELLFWTFDRPHHMDMGCYLPTTMNIWAKDVWEEGLHVPPMRVARAYKIDEHFLNFLMANIRYPKLFKGDYLACIGSMWTGEKRLIELCKRYGLETIKQFIEEYQDYGDRRMTEEIKKLPQGTWYGEERADPFPFCPEGVTLRLKMTIDPDETTITFDMTECDDQVPGGINATWATARAGCLAGLLACLDPHLPRNWGVHKHVKFIQREGSICHPKWPASAFSSTYVLERLINCVWKMFCQFAPEKGHAGAGLEGAAMSVLVGKDFRRNNEDYGTAPFIANAGGPASVGYDGWVGFCIPGVNGAMLNEPVEWHELRYPHIVWEVYFPPDSGGYGKWRGAPGIRYRFQPQHTELQILPCGSGLVYPAGGVLGGGPGTVSSHRVVDARTGKTIKELGHKELGHDAPVYLIKEEEIWEGTACGGGGFGDPLERDPELVRWDAREETISLEAARDVYGVMLNTEPETYEVDYEATKRLREKLKRRRDDRETEA